MGLKMKICSPGGLLSTLPISPFPSSMVLENQAREESECGCGRREEGRVRQRRKMGEERKRRREEKLQKRLERDGERNGKEGDGERERERLRDREAERDRASSAAVGSSLVYTEEPDSLSEKLRLSSQHNFHYVNVALKYIAQSAATIKLSIIMSTQTRKVLQTEG